MRSWVYDLEGDFDLDLSNFDNEMKELKNLKKTARGWGSSLADLTVICYRITKNSTYDFSPDLELIAENYLPISGVEGDL